MRKLTSLIALVVVLFVSCNTKAPVTTEHTLPATDVTKDSAGHTSPGTEIAKDMFATGQLIPAVKLRIHPSETYALYLPKGYSDTSLLPVIIFFDPHGDGSLPLNLYRGLADEYKFVLVGSNSTKNGMDFGQVRKIADNLVDEVMGRLFIQQKNIAVCGFSGGAQVALVCAAENPAVSAAIYCGAASKITPTHAFTLLGFAGTRDMNYTDVIAFDRGLKGSPFNHYLVEWNGKHEFPRADVFRDAFQLLKTGTISNYKSKRISTPDQVLGEEHALKQQLYSAFRDKDIDWWRQEIAMLNVKKQGNPMYERLLGLVSLACYSYAGQTLQQNDLKSAEKILAIYALADPGNKDCAAFTEQLKARQSAH